jgi:mannose-6-phosphate isomerase-like protein (cupin superfamily)
VKEMVDEEVHYDILESFVLLEGSCECHITNEKGETRIVRMGQGDYISMKLGETHDIVITSSKPAKAILEWRKLAA